MSKLINRTTKSDYSKDIQDVLFKEAKALLELSDNISEGINETVEMILECKGRLVITGVGKSGIVGKKMAATFASTGTPSFFLHPAEGLHGDLGMVTSTDIVLALSNSGESEEVLNIVPSVKRIGAKIIGLVGNEDSTLAKKADRVLSIGKVQEACPLGLAPTTSTTLTLALGDALAIALLKAREFKPENFAVFHPGGSLGKRLLLTIRDIIEDYDKNPIAFRESSVKDVIFKMTSSGLGAISIVNEKGKIIGILTDGDLRRALVSGVNPLEETIEKIYNENPITISESTLAAEALGIMEEKRINVLPIVDEYRQPVSMIHLQNLTKLGI
ncbi:KpsF/GutQ family sugar-phosphate isomerase [Bacillus cereus group sp. RP37]|uniref:KpsF/GutQ family sugar-phosphate isomerase n=1 Tax=Bacillus cereus group TaxID=86661 RepID=UPI002E23CB3D|nr:KpsF/GutQ family sugar-phosphate isomerase [Bacillus cereus]MED0996597.1 KpsF/GutQ family sugar-phosphate isomerase [Bacillus mobilis]